MPTTPLPWIYPALMVVSVAVAVVLSRGTQRRLGISKIERVGIALGAFCGAMIGAKLPFVLSDWEGLKSGQAWFDGGKTILFGLVGGYFGVELAKWSLGLRLKTGDTFAVPVPAAVAVGRLACFFGGCCYGKPTDLPWGVDFGDQVCRHPTQLYESLFHASMAAILAILRARGLFRGQLIKIYILAYLVYRFFSEFLRPEPILFGGLTGYQWASLVLMPVFVGLWVLDAREDRTPVPSEGSGGRELGV